MLPGKVYSPDEVVKIGWRYRWWLIVPVVLTSAAAAIYSLWMPNKYRSETLILVVPQRVPENYVRSTVTTRIEDRLRSLSQEIMSRTRLERIIDDFNLYDWRRGAVPMEDIVEGMRSQIGIDIVRGDAFRISYVSPDPQTAMRVTERLAGLFIEENLQDRTNMAEGTNRFLESQLEDARRRLEEHEKKLELFRRRYSGQLPEQMPSNLQIINGTQLQLQAVRESINRDRDRRLLLQRELSALERQAESPPDRPAATLTRGGDPASLTGGTAAQQLSLAREQLQALELRFTPEHPDIVRWKSLIRELEVKAAEEELQRPLAPAGAALSPEEAEQMARLRDLRLEIETLDRQIAQKQAEADRHAETIAMYQVRVEAVPALESERTSLMRDYDTLKAQYAELLKKSEDSKMAANLERRQIGEQFRILDPARIPERPVSPNRPMIWAMGTILGLGLGVGLVSLTEYRDRSLRTDQDVMGVLALPVLAAIPVMRTRAERLRRKQQILLMTATGVVLAAVAGLVTWQLLPWQRVVERLW